MDYYKPIDISCFDLIKDRTKEFAKELKLVPFTKELLYSRRMLFSEEDQQVINKEFELKGLSKIKDVLIFKRWSSLKYDMNSIHIDGTLDKIYNCSLVIPVSGCKDTEQYWYDGEYEITQIVGKSGIAHLIPKWKSSPKLVDSVHIENCPMLCRVNIPHSAYGNGKQFRLTCTLRFENNETFEEIYEKLSKSS